MSSGIGIDTDTDVDQGDVASRAREDALRDMSDAGLQPGEDLQSRFLRCLKLQYSASFLVRNSRTGDEEHGLTKHIAEGPDEALGRMYRELMDQFPCEDGWQPPSILIDDDPSLLMPGVDTPVCFADEDGDGVCPTCGYPYGPCEDPDVCVHNPEHGLRPVVPLDRE